MTIFPLKRYNLNMETEKLLTKRELAELLNISESTINRWMKDGTLPYIKFPQAVRFRKKDVEKLIEKKTIK